MGEDSRGGPGWPRGLGFTMKAQATLGALSRAVVPFVL